MEFSKRLLAFILSRPNAPSSFVKQVTNQPSTSCICIRCMIADFSIRSIFLPTGQLARVRGSFAGPATDHGLRLQRRQAHGSRLDGARRGGYAPAGTDSETGADSDVSVQDVGLSGSECKSSRQSKFRLFARSGPQGAVLSNSKTRTDFTHFLSAFQYCDLRIQETNKYNIFSFRLSQLMGFV